MLVSKAAYTCYDAIWAPGNPTHNKLFLSFAVLQMMDDQPSEPEEESEVKVLILSPRCWAVSSPCYMDNHSRYFPKQLCTYLAEFTDFYSNSQSPSVISFQKVCML